MTNIKNLYEIKGLKQETVSNDRISSFGFKSSDNRPSFQGTTNPDTYDDNNLETSGPKFYTGSYSNS